MYTKTHVEHCRTVQNPPTTGVFASLHAVAGASWKPFEFPGVTGQWLSPPSLMDGFKGRMIGTRYILLNHLEPIQRMLQFIRFEIGETVPSHEWFVTLLFF